MTVDFSIEKLIDASTYLSRLAEKSSHSINTATVELPALLQALCDSLNESLDCADEKLFDSAEDKLLQAKVDFTLLWSLAELQSVATARQRGIWQTQFAQCSIDYALRLAWLAVAKKNRAIAKQVEQTNGDVAGLFIFGMGKLGGNDLNFSSDVDLVAYFDPAVIPVPDAIGKSYVCHQVLQKLTQLLGQGGRSNFVWRVDWRLRPNASATTLAMSVSAAEDYYFYRASPWHRLALMKARVVAGDKALGEVFLKTIDPFIWRQNLDYRALDELAEIKQRINLEHPSLRAQRQWREPIGDDIVGFNVKLGSGGIREIEFIANALQLVWGGRIRELRTPHTVTALDELSKRNRLESDSAVKLVHSYRLLRSIENALQMMDNQQTHVIPKSPEAQRNVLVLLKLDSWAELVKKVNTERRLVNQAFEVLFAEQAAAQGQAPIWPDGLSDKADTIVEAWENGYQIYGVSNQVRHRLLPLTRALAEYLKEAQEDSSHIIMRLHDFFRALPTGEQYFRLLAESPELLHRFVPPLLHSPAMTNLLRQSPHIIDCYVRGEWQYPEPFDSAYVRQSDNYEQRLERMRRFVNEHLYQLYLNFLQGRMDVQTFQAALSDLAEHTLQLALRVVADHMELDEVPITVIGMGKVALRRMSPLSDLDLIFLFDPGSVSLELALKYVSRLQTAISTPMREGMVYELDTRLRPSGKSGAPTVSIDSFAQHHTERAHTWEHIALMPSRVVAGNPALVEQISKIKHHAIITPRNKEQFFKDSLKMWNRIDQHRLSDASPELMHSKLRKGGLMQAEYLAACLILQGGPDLELNSTDFDECLTASVAGSEIGHLSDIIQFWRIQQLWERLLGMTDAPLSELPKRYLARLLEQSGVDSLPELIEKKRAYSEAVEQALQSFFASVDMSQQEVDDWPEQAVQWAEH
jgi:glutamate-ammonia-ligase adenylyltransferase